MDRYEQEQFELVELVREMLYERFVPFYHDFEKIDFWWGNTCTGNEKRNRELDNELAEKYLGVLNTHLKIKVFAHLTPCGRLSLILTVLRDEVRRKATLYGLN